MVESFEHSQEKEAFEKEKKALNGILSLRHSEITKLRVELTGLKGRMENLLSAEMIEKGKNNELKRLVLELKQEILRV